MIIGIDIDDTISDTYEVMINYAQEYQINELKREPILKKGSCNTHFYLTYLLDWNNGEDKGFLNEYYERIVKETKPRTLALKYLQKLHEDGNKIVLITARWEAENFDVRKATENWIKANNVPCDKLIINAKNKLIAAQSENVDVFIDDSFSNCKQISDAGIKTFLMDSRSNKEFEDEKIERIYSWPHAYMKIN